MHTLEARTNWSHVFLIAGAGVVSAFQVGKATAALSIVQVDLGLDLATASWLLSAFAVIGAAAGAAIGLAVDHVGAQRMAASGLALQAIASALGALSPDAAPLLATRVIEGFGFLAVTVAAPALIVEVTAARDRDRATAIWATFMPVGMTAILLAAPLLGAVGWRGFWLLNAALLLVYAATIHRFVRVVARAAHRSIAKDIRAIAGARDPWILGSLFAMFTAAFFAVFGFLPSILSYRLGVGHGVGNILTAVAVAASAAGNLVCGQLLASGWRPFRLLIWSFGLLALCGFGIFPEMLPAAGAYLLSVVFSFVSGFIPVVLIDAVPRHAPRPELVGATMGFAMQGNNIGLLVGPAAAGAMAAAWGWSSIALLVAAVVLAAAALVAVLNGGRANQPLTK